MSEYRDTDGSEISLYRLINKEPEWAVNIIEKLKAENKALKESRDELLDSQVKANCEIASKLCDAKDSIKELLNLLPDSRLKGDDWKWCWNELSDESQQSVKRGRKKAEAIKEKTTKCCIWKEEKDVDMCDVVFDTSCGNTFVFIDGNPKDNGFK